MTDQHGYSVDRAKMLKLKSKDDKRSKSIFDLCCKLLRGQLVYEELTKHEQSLLESSDCFVRS